MPIIIKTIMKNYGKRFRYTVFQIPYPMHSTSISPCIMTMISNFTVFFISQIFIFELFFTITTDFAFCNSCCSFVNNFILFFFKINFHHCLLRIHKTFSYNLYLFVSHVYFICFCLKLL